MREHSATRNQPDDTDRPVNVPDAIRVLVVDDDKMSRVLLTHQLASLGIQAENASGGAEALSALDRSTFDFIFCDYRMPGMDGPALTRVIRERERKAAAADAGGQSGKAVYIVAVSANADLEQAQDCLNAGMNDVLAKPVEGSSLRAIFARRAVAGSPQSITREAGQIFDPSLLVRIYGRSARLRTIVEQWIASAESAVKHVRRAADMRDDEALKNAAHRLHGSAAIAGAQRLATAAEQLESAVLEDSAQMGAAIAHVASEAAHAVTSARSFLESI